MLSVIREDLIAVPCIRIWCAADFGKRVVLGGLCSAELVDPLRMNAPSLLTPLDPSEFAIRFIAIIRLAR
jgi:hypothetical protein